MKRTVSTLIAVFVMGMASNAWAADVPEPITLYWWEDGDLYWSSDFTYLGTCVYGDYCDAYDFNFCTGDPPLGGDRFAIYFQRNDTSYEYATMYEDSSYVDVLDFYNQNTGAIWLYSDTDLSILWSNNQFISWMRTGYGGDDYYVLIYANPHPC